MTPVSFGDGGRGLQIIGNLNCLSVVYTTVLLLSITVFLSHRDDRETFSFL